MIAGGMLVIAGMSIKILSLFCLAVIIATPIIFNGLHDYQKQRIENFLNPEKNHLSSGYNIFQSKIAIGSGGLSGKGIGQGTQTNLKFLPEKHTDFIFAGLAEDLGFIGSVIFLILVYLIIWTNYFVGRNSKIVFHKMLVHGVNMLFFSHICLNIGMVSGMLPVVGIPLPLISYGGTIFWITLLSFGLTVNVHVNRNVKI